MRRALLATALILLASVARASIPCDCDATCPGRAPIEAGPYDADGGLHEAWYEGRFWEGRCPPALGGENCLRPDSFLARLFGADTPGWYDLMAAVLTTVPETARPALCQRLHALGRDMGREWARLNHVRRICTDDLTPLFRRLDDTDTPLTVIAEMEALTRQRLAGDVPCDPA
jgi:hypothetical protein